MTVIVGGGFTAYKWFLEPDNAICAATLVQARLALTEIEGRTSSFTITDASSPSDVTMASKRESANRICRSELKLSETRSAALWYRVDPTGGLLRTPKVIGTGLDETGRSAVLAMGDEGTSVRPR